MSENKEQRPTYLPATADWYISAVLSMDEEVNLEKKQNKDINRAVDVLLDGLAAHHDIVLFERQRELEGFYYRYHSQWGTLFQSLEFAILAHEGAGVLFKQHHDVKYPSDEEKSFQYSALILLHARACQVAREVLVLVRAGYADGALSRWRALYEMATVAEFIKEHSDETAERFLKYQIVTTWWDGKKYDKYQEDLGFEPLPDGTIEGLSEQVNSLTDEFGNSFKSNWGWAEKDLEGDASRRRVAEEVGTVKYSPFYAMASNAVHGGSKGTQYRLGIGGSVLDTALPLGPTNRGFEDPVQLTSLMIYRVTAALLELGEEPHWDVITAALEDIAHDVIGEMVSVTMKSQVEEMEDDLLEAATEHVEERILEQEGIDRLEEIEADEVEIDDDIIEEIANGMAEILFSLGVDQG